MGKKNKIKPNPEISGTLKSSKAYKKAETDINEMT